MMAWREFNGRFGNLKQELSTDYTDFTDEE